VAMRSPHASKKVGLAAPCVIPVGIAAYESAGVVAMSELERKLPKLWLE
jgi:hypothetical protein